MAHARRKFDEALKSQLNPDPASLPGVALQKIKALYRIEREAADLTCDERQTKRKQEAIPLLDDLRHWLDEHLPLVPRQSALGKALNYLHRQWPTLIVYTEHGDLRIDNNLVESSIRPFVVGKNYLFMPNPELCRTRPAFGADKSRPRYFCLFANVVDSA